MSRVGLKLAVTVFTDLPFQILWPKWIKFFRSFQNKFGLWVKNDQKNKCRRWPLPAITSGYLSTSSAVFLRCDPTGIRTPDLPTSTLYLTVQIIQPVAAAIPSFTVKSNENKLGCCEHWSKLFSVVYFEEFTFIPGYHGIFSSLEGPAWLNALLRNRKLGVQHWRKGCEKTVLQISKFFLRF